MSDAAPTERELRLLAVVGEGEGRWDARWIDVTTSIRHGPSDIGVHHELVALEAKGLVSVRDGGTGGRWGLSPAGRDVLADGGTPGPPPSWSP